MIYYHLHLNSNELLPTNLTYSTSNRPVTILLYIKVHFITIIYRSTLNGRRLSQKSAVFFKR